MSLPAPLPHAWDSVREQLHARGMRWTSQRRIVLEALLGAHGHVTGAALVERCRTVDATTTPSTVYRTLDVLEALGLVRHAHGVDGREEYHVGDEPEHGHLYCERCGGRWELTVVAAREIRGAFQRVNGFQADLTHMTIVGRCADCAARR